MPKTPCRDAFNESAKIRTAHPLPSGAYKLRDALHWLSHMKRSMDEISNHLNNPGNYAIGQMLGHCGTTDDIDTWIKDIPIQVAQMLGRDILPAIAALTGDGIPQSDVTGEVARANPDATKLLNDCEHQRKRLQRGIKGEYKMMKTGYSDVYALLVGAEIIAETALQLIDEIDARRAKMDTKGMTVEGAAMISLVSVYGADPNPMKEVQREEHIGLIFRNLLG
jgi:hypothetical protein